LIKEKLKALRDMNASQPPCQKSMQIWYKLSKVTKKEFFTAVLSKGWLISLPDQSKLILLAM